MAIEITEDAVLGGRLTLRQPRRGHRVGHDAILLAAATEVRTGEHVVELGAGVGAAGLAVAQRVAGVRVTLVEIAPALAALARDNAARNGVADRVQVAVLDVAASDRDFAEGGIEAGTATRVLMNPPFNNAASKNLSPNPKRRLAHAASADTLTHWIDRAASLLAPSGTLTLIWRADGLADVLAMASRGFGRISVLPVYPRPNAAAIRILLRATKASRAPLVVMPGLTLNDTDGRPSMEAETILRDGRTLRWEQD